MPEAQTAAKDAPTSDLRQGSLTPVGGKSCVRVATRINPAKDSRMKSVAAELLELLNPRLGSPDRFTSVKCFLCDIESVLQEDVAAFG
jgi:hypothetical protein